MGCEYVCRCKTCAHKPDNGRCGRTVTGVALLTNMDAHTCGDLTVCGDFFCKECWAVCRIDPERHTCRPPGALTGMVACLPIAGPTHNFNAAGDAGTLTPEHLLNIEKRVEARREGKRRRRAEQAVLREVCVAMRRRLR